MTRQKRIKMKTWILEENKFNADEALAWEGLFAQGSGYLQLRGSHEESFADSPQNIEYERGATNVSVEKFVKQTSKCGTFIPGIYGKNKLFHREIINLPNPLRVELYVGDEKLDLVESEIVDYSRTLNLKNGLLERNLTWKTKSGITIKLNHKRFADAAHEHLILQQIDISSDKNIDVEIVSKIDADVRTNGSQHFNNIKYNHNESIISCELCTDCDNDVNVVSEMLGEDWVYSDHCELRKTIKLEANRSVVVEKRSALSTSRDKDKISAALAIANVDEMTFAELFASNEKLWSERWNKCDIEIIGDDESQLAIRVSLYHLLRSQVNDDRVAICAKGFAGEAYWGLFFWDTEMFMMPFFLYTDPQKAKTLMDFRIKNLENAKKNAASYGCSGARFPWQSDHEGNECCAKSLWQYRDHEIHVTADVVYGFYHYAQATGDDSYLTKNAAETIIETCKFWMDRIDYQNGKPNILAVMGPDEYNPFFNNNAFTNRLVKLSLNLGARIGKENGVSNSEIQRWINTAKELPIVKREDGVILQHESYENLAEPQFEKYWKDKSVPYAATVSQDRNYRSKSSKQPDVLQMMFLFASEFSKGELKQAFDYYMPYCTHDSSLSPGIHGLIAAQLGINDVAWDFWKETSNLDLNVKKGKAENGIHIACSAATWQYVVFGFAGVKHAVESNVLTINPNLPKQWEKISFPLSWKGHSVKVTINKTEVVVENKSNKPLAVSILETNFRIEANQQKTTQIKER